MYTTVNLFAFVVFISSSGTHSECIVADTCPEECTCTRGGITVDCQNRGLPRVPRKLPATALILKLNGNNITSVDNISFARCHSLQVLDLSWNNITSFEGGAFRDTQNLSCLNLHDNHIPFQIPTFPPGTFDPLSNLQELNIANNLWKWTHSIRDDIVRNKPHLKRLSLDAPSNFSLGSEFSKLASLQSLGVYGGLSRLGNDTFSSLRNLSVTKLTLRGNNLKYLDVLTFSHFPKLQCLDLSGNHDLQLGQNLYQSWYGLRNSDLRVLNLSSVVKQFDYIASTLRADFFVYLTETPLRELLLDVNGLVKIDAKFHIVLPRLQKLSLAYNRFFDYVNEVTLDAASMKELYYLDLSQQTKFPTLSGTNGVIIDKVGNRKNHNLLFYLPRKIEYMNLSATFPASYKIINKIYWFSGELRMKNLDLSNNKVDEIYGQLILVHNQSVEIDRFNLSGCGMKYLSYTFNQPKFIVHTIDMSYNNLGAEFAEDKDGTFLHQFAKSLRAIDCSANRIRSLSKGFFSQVSSLERLILKNNALNLWQPSISHNLNLSFLDLSSNLISYLSPESRREFDEMQKNRPFALNLAGNPIDCACPGFDFLKWMSTTKVNILNRDNYTCHVFDKIISLNNLTGIIRNLEVECSSRTWVIVTGLSCALLVVVVSSAVALYRHRWDIRYCCLKIRRQGRAYDALINERSFHFDAFVAYHQSALMWIRHQLLPHLEGCPDPINLCIHHRNWLPGPTIEENISFSVENSRKTLALLSKDFLTSGWCEFEVEMARLRGFEEGKQIIVVVALEEIPIESMNRTLANLRRTHTWLDWFEYENEREQFWELLRQALRQ